VGQKNQANRKRTYPTPKYRVTGGHLCDEVTQFVIGSARGSGLNANQSKLLTTVLAIPNYRLQPTGNTMFRFWETPPGQPKALRAWFYPGDNFGQEFAYPKRDAVTIATMAHAPVPSTEEVNPEKMPTTAVQTVTEASDQPIAQLEPAPAPPPLKLQEANALPPELPKTASPYPVLGLAGLFALVGFAVVRLVRTS
jgi:hypothetical protein